MKIHTTANAAIEISTQMQKAAALVNDAAFINRAFPAMQNGSTLRDAYTTLQYALKTVINLAQEESLT